MTNFWKQLPQPFFVLAPMENVTDVVFREIVATELPKPDVFFTEFTSTDALCTKGRDKAIEKLKFTENQRPIVAQIWGIHPENYFISAQLVQELGFDAVDINMACPDKNVMKGGAGGALINNHPLVKEIIEAVKGGASHIPISVKTRLGYNQIVTEEWISFLLEQKLEALTIHGRVAKQMSHGEANWEEIAKAVELKNSISPDTVIVGNGDVLSQAQAIERYEASGVDGVMIGRGIFHNPWVFEKSLEPQVHAKEKYIQILKKHVQLHHETWGDTKHFEALKKFFKMYINNFPNASELRQKLMECHTAAEVQKVLESDD